MPKTSLALMMTSALLVLSACQPPSDHPAPSQSKQTEEPSSTQSLKDAKNPRQLTTALVDMSEKKLKDQLVCSKLTATINAVGNTSEIKNIHDVQHQLKACLPTADNAQILQWLADYQAMYRRFLGSDSDWNDEAFYDVMSTIEQGKTITVPQLRQVNPRILYLISLVRSKADVSVIYLGEGIYAFHHDLQAMADLFTPYLPEDQAVFIQRMAKDNQDIFWNDAAIAISYYPLIKRAVFWEEYIKQYPDSYFIKDAERLFNRYRFLLFFGSENTQWTDDAFHNFLEPEYSLLLRQLLKRQNSRLAENARVFLEFMRMSDRERQQQYPMPKTENNENENGNKNNRDESKTPYYQLKEALAIPSPWDSYDNKDCLSSITCIDQDINQKAPKETEKE
ncbi:hypothetical protein [uncultured Psychrobacter sp.]|uniref:hypothetical protein n=1 Tax=uncultured Psychrobacter sp. TaxID=259303 RepID=UPI00345B33AB